MPYIGKEPADIIATAVDTTTGTFSGAVTAASLAADGGITVDNISIDATEIDLSSGSFTIDSAANITLDCGTGEFLFNNGGNGNLLKIQADSSNVNLITMVQDKDLVFKGNDGGSTITALTLDMSAAGAATFNGNIITNGNILQSADNSSNTLGGGSASNTGGNINVYGSSHSSLASNIRFRSGSTVTMLMDSSGAMTRPLQPAFSAIATGQTDLAVSSTLQIGFAGTERFDQNSDFNTSNSTFTAPVTGKYQFNVGVRVKAIDTGAGYVLIRLKTSNASYDHIFDSDEFSSDLDFSFFAFSILADMDAADTCIIEFFQNGGTQQTDIDSASYWSGYLVA
jgi:hypothetical protein